MDLPNTRLWRDDSRPKAGSPLIVIPTALSVPPCSELSRYGLATAKRVERSVRRPTLTAPARAGFAILRVGAKKRDSRSNKRNRSRKQERKIAALKPLDNKSPIQGFARPETGPGFSAAAAYFIRQRPGTHASPSPKAPGS